MVLLAEGECRGGRSRPRPSPRRLHHASMASSSGTLPVTTQEYLGVLLRRSQYAAEALEAGRAAVRADDAEDEDEDEAYDEEAGWRETARDEEAEDWRRAMQPRQPPSPPPCRLLRGARLLRSAESPPKQTPQKRDLHTQPKYHVSPPPRAKQAILRARVPKPPPAPTAAEMDTERERRKFRPPPPRALHTGHGGELTSGPASSHS